MDRTRLARSVIAIAAVSTGLVGLFAVLTVINAGDGFASCTVSARLGWMIPLLSGAVLGGVAWMLLSNSDTDGDDDRASADIVCPTCGKSVLVDWRLCPHCGVRLDRERRADAGAEQTRNDGTRRRARF